MSLALASCGTIPPSVDSPPPAAADATPAAPDGSETAPVTPSDPPSKAPEPEPTPAPKPTPKPTPKGPDCRKLKCIALTYDDGPFPDEAAELAQTLRTQRVKATFFMLGQNVHQYPEAVKDLASTGSELANHSWNHPSLPGLGTDGMTSQLERTNDAIAKVTGVRPTLMRPPYGSTNKRLDKVAQQLGLAEIFWNVDTEDWKNKNPDRLINYVLDNAARDQVVLMHDIHSSTVAAAPAIIRGLKADGYTLVTVSDLYPKLRPGGHYPKFAGKGLARERDYRLKRRG
ncbi:MAG TPA: polysaccharide deacetylase family protein [Microlunatus sp.]